MACSIATVDNFFVVRWGTPVEEDFDRVIQEVSRLHDSRGEPLFYVGVMPHEMGGIDEQQRKGFMRLTEAILPHCQLVCVAVEARGFRGSIMRSAMTAVSLLTRRFDKLRFVDTVDAALRLGQELWLADRGAMIDAIAQTGTEIPECLREVA